MRSLLVFSLIFISTAVVYSADTEEKSTTEEETSREEEITEGNIAPDIIIESNNDLNKPKPSVARPSRIYSFSGYVTRSTRAKKGYWQVTMIKTLGEQPSQITFFYKKKSNSSPMDSSDNEILSHHRVRSLGTESEDCDTETTVHRRTRTLGTTSEGIDREKHPTHHRTYSSGNDSDDEKIKVNSHIKVLLKKENHRYYFLSFEKEDSEKKTKEIFKHFN